MTEPDEQRIATLLRTTPVPAPRVDIARAVRDGRRRRDGRRNGAIAAVTVVAGLGVAGGAVVVAGDPSPAPPPVATSSTAASPTATSPGVTASTAGAAPAVTCAAERLSMPLQGEVAVAYHVDPTGRHVAGDIGSGQEDGRVVVWIGGKATVLPATVEYAAAINANGIVVGTGGNGVGWIWRDGQVSTLTTPAGYNRVLVHDINSRGDIVGTANGTGDTFHAVTWSADRPRQARLIGGPGSQASAITDDGTVVGTIDGKPHRWTAQGEATPLGLPEGHSTALIESVHGTWAHGLVGDRRSEDTGTITVMRPVRWNLTTGAAEKLPWPGIAAITADGSVVVNGALPEVHAVDGTMYRLPGLPDAPPDAVYSVVSVSDDGLTASGDIREHQKTRPVVWRCRR